MRISLPTYKKIVFAALVALVAIIITGGTVRLTSSGLGCPDWPNCEEGQLVADLEYHALVEFINRVITGLTSLAVILAVLGAIFLDISPVRKNRAEKGKVRKGKLTEEKIVGAIDTPKTNQMQISWRQKKELIWWSVGLVIGVLAQVIIGAVVVSSHLAPHTVMLHFLVSMVLVLNAVILHHRTLYFLSNPLDNLHQQPHLWQTAITHPQKVHLQKVMTQPAAT